MFDLEVCLITAPRLVALWREVRARRRLLPARIRHVVLRLDRAGGLHLVVETVGAAPWPKAAALGAALQAAGMPATLWLRPEEGAARVAVGSDEAFPATVFEQVHPAMGDRVRAHAISLLGDVAGETVWDLYAGIGDTTRALAARGAVVVSVEADRRAVAYAEGRRDPGAIERSRWIAQGATLSCRSRRPASASIAPCGKRR